MVLNLKFVPFNAILIIIHFTTTFLNFIDNLSTTVDTEHTLGILLDISEAFAFINYDILLYKLCHDITQRVSLEGFRSYLANKRKYCIYWWIWFSIKLCNLWRSPRFNTRSVTLHLWFYQNIWYFVIHCICWWF